MKRNFLIFTFSILANLSYSQVVLLDINNPAPRVGEDIDIKYDIMLTDNEIEFPISSNELKDLKKNTIGDGKLTLKNYTSDTGDVVIGPLNFQVDGKSFQSDTLILKVYSKLPNIKDGFWIRYLNYRGQYFLITEQRISGEWTNKRDSKNSYSMTFSSDGVEYAEIPRNSIKFEDLEVNFSYSTSGSRTVEGDDDSESTTVHYKLYVYKVKIKDTYNGDFVIKKKNFDNFPKGIKFKPVVLHIN